MEQLEVGNSSQNQDPHPPLVLLEEILNLPPEERGDQKSRMRVKRKRRMQRIPRQRRMTPKTAMKREKMRTPRKKKNQGQLMELGLRKTKMRMKMISRREMRKQMMTPTRMKEKKKKKEIKVSFLVNPRRSQPRESGAGE